MVPCASCIRTRAFLEGHSVGQPGLENSGRPSVDGTSQACDESSASKGDDADRKTPDSEPVGPAVGPALDVEAALADALSKAAAAGRWDVVAQLARELEARRLASAGNVVALAAKRGRS